MSPVRRGTNHDAAAIARRVADQLAREAMIEPLISPHFSRSDFEYALAHSVASLWVDESHAKIRGHLYGHHFDDPLHGRQTWTGPDGYSYDVANVLDKLCERAEHEWRAEGSTAHLVWVAANGDLAPWRERGYDVVGVRGATALGAPREVAWPPHHRLRRGTRGDLATALEFDRLIDRAQGVDLDALREEQRAATEADLVELLDDPECHYYVLDVDEQPTAQCITFPLPTLRGSFERTVYVGSLAVVPAAQRRGVASALVAEILNRAVADGFEYAEARWHADNQPASAFWAALGFRPTYLQLRRSFAD